MILRYLEKVVCGEEMNFGSKIVRALLLPFSWLYLGGLKFYLKLYDWGLKKRTRLGVPVICVGNITFGGTGKTPFVRMLCEFLQKNGVRPVVLTRGHGVKHEGTIIVSDYENVLANAGQAGDEPYLLAKALPGVPVLVDRDRRRSGAWACENLKPDVIVLDDGMQYWQLEKDVIVVIMDAVRPFGSGYVMPAGDMRESEKSLERADLMVFSHCESVTNDHLIDLARRLNKYVDYDNMFCASHIPVKLTGEEGETDLSFLKDKDVTAFCGIGNPNSFFDTLERLGARVCGRIIFSDHMDYTEADMADVEHIAAGRIVVTTEKDAAKLEDMYVPNLYVLDIEFDLEDEERFEDRLKKHLVG